MPPGPFDPSGGIGAAAQCIKALHEAMVEAFPNLATFRVTLNLQSEYAYGNEFLSGLTSSRIAESQKRKIPRDVEENVFLVNKGSPRFRDSRGFWNSRQKTLMRRNFHQGFVVSSGGFGGPPLVPFDMHTWSPCG